MAKAVLEGAKEKGAEAVLLAPDEFDVSIMESTDAIAFGCPAMEELRYWKKTNLNRCLLPVNQNFQEKAIALFGSYGWGDESG